MCMQGNSTNTVNNIRQNGLPVACTSFGYQRANVCVPVTVIPFANALPTVTKCCDMPIITQDGTCTGMLNGMCFFTITQQICVEVPVEFGATTEVGMPSVQCLAASNNDCVGCV